MSGDEDPPVIGTTKPPGPEPCGGLQFRIDGLYWRCFAIDGKGAEVELGSLLYVAALKNLNRRHEFRVLMLETFADFMQLHYGKRPRIDANALMDERIRDHGFPPEGHA